MLAAGTEVLVERGADLERVDALLDAVVGGRGGLLIVSGEAGIGKTALLRAAGSRAERRGVRVLLGRGGALERDFAYGIVRQLLDLVVADASDAERAQLLSGAARLSSAVLSPSAGDGETQPSASSAFAVSHALYWLVAHLAAARPVLLMVDDVQWCDNASLRWILFLARRLAEMQAGLVAAWRTGEPDAPTELLGSLAVDPLADDLEPAPLSPRGAAMVIEEALGDRPSDAFVAACHELTDGNPFFLRELARAVSAGGAKGLDADIAQIRSLDLRAISRSVLLRLAPLPADAKALARAAAVLDTDAAAPFAASLAGLGAKRATVAADALQRAEILDAGERLRFRHPILRLVVYSQLTPPQRSSAHRRAAEVLRAGGEPDRAAVHLLATVPAGDPLVVSELHGAARRVLARGAPDASIALLDRALAEPPATGVRATVLLDRGRAAAATLAGDAEAILRMAREEARDVREQAAAADELGRVLVVQRRVPEAIAVLDGAARRVAAADAERAAKLELMSGLLHSYGPVGDFRQAERRMQSLGRRPGLSGPLRLAALSAEMAAAVSADLARPTDRFAAYRAMVDDQLGAALEAFGPSHALFTYIPFILGSLGDPAEGLKCAQATTEAARRRGDVLGELMSMAIRGRLLWVMGRLADAEGDARVALDAGVEGGYAVLRVFAGATVAYVQADRHALDDAERVLSRFEGAGVASTSFDAPLYGARARLRLAQGRLTEALEDVDVYFGVYARGSGLPPFPWVRTVRTRALLGLGRVDEARAWGREEVARFRPHGPAYAFGESLAVLGLAEGGAPGLACLDEAVAVLRRSQRRLELGRALIDHGAALRRAGRRVDARDLLREGMEIAARCAAAGLVDQARSELQATGARPRGIMRSGLDALTPSERRVAAMAGEGMTNSQIAQALFVTAKTVETHLRHVFQKLDVTSRRQLADALAESPAQSERGIAVAP